MLTRDQHRAQFAYRAVEYITDEAQRKDYKIAVHAFGAEILRSGLAAAMAGLERREGKGDRLRSDLANPNAGIPGLVQPNRSDIPILQVAPTKDNLSAKIRSLPLDDYILATRETLQIVLWLKRAVQAKF
jgi:CRISPR-associated protein Cmr5